MALSKGGHMDKPEVYEVFVRKGPLDHHVHVGSLVAPDPEMALHFARENFLRRDQGENIWIVPQTQVISSDYDPAFFARELNRKYREVSGYTENGRLWRMFKEKAISLEEIVDYIDGKNAREKREKGGGREK
jgi:ring-1,2-phenylacetyl-CoA epoxidase subunit PaaB